MVRKIICSPPQCCRLLMLLGHYQIALGKLGDDCTIDRVNAALKERDYYKGLAVEATRKEQALRVAHNAQGRILARYLNCMLLRLPM